MKQMSRHINNPYKVNWKMYSFITTISLLVMIIAVGWYECTQNIISDVVKNLAFGCVASTIVALLVEIGNVKEKNEKANRVYDSVYKDLQFCTIQYVATWSRVCYIAYKDKDYKQETHTWSEWYEITKSEFAECDEKRQEERVVL